MSKTAHVPVLLEETIENLNLKSGQTVIDCTLGNAGHSLEMAKRIGEKGILIGIDLDQESLRRAEEELRDQICQKIFINNNFKNITQVVAEIKNKNGKGKLNTINVILSDLGLAFYHYQEEGESTGFSFRKEAALDMRLDQESELTAAKIVNTYSEEELVEIFSKYAEERKSKTVAREIVRVREIKELRKLLN